MGVVGGPSRRCRRAWLLGPLAATVLVTVIPGTAFAGDRQTTVKLGKPAHSCADPNTLYVPVNLKRAHRDGTFELAAYEANYTPSGAVTFTISGTSYRDRLAVPMDGPLPQGRSTAYFVLYRELGGDRGAVQLTYSRAQRLARCR